MTSGAARRYLEMAERHSGELSSLLATDEELLTDVGAALRELSSLVFCFRTANEQEFEP